MWFLVGDFSSHYVPHRPVKCSLGGVALLSMPGHCAKQRLNTCAAVVDVISCLPGMFQWEDESMEGMVTKYAESSSAVV